MDGSFVAFLGISAVVIATPGQDTALTIRNTLLGGRSAGIATAAGVAAGQLSWTVAAAVGLTAILVASEAAFTAVRLLGAAYLVYLGAHSLWRAIRPVSEGPVGGPPAASRGQASLAPRRALRSGVLSNLGNPKMAVFFSSLLPQFVAPGPGAAAGMLGLGLVFVSMTFVWLSAYAVVVARAGNVLRRPRVRRAIEAVTGAVLLAFGGRLAAEDR
jgi:threonine/homoserine/homoserine lactone efflux protein